MRKGRFNSGLLAEDWGEGSKVRFLVIVRRNNTPLITLVRQMARLTQPINAPAESGQRVI